ncbi:MULTISPECIES: Gfo/Idh/MocA family protein [Priestia]|uniref:Oxidoreductase, Gfo/Idh/Moca family n=1 Tax=Priestia megaterium (strain ATCC 12872 / QMB1551) TaxID=545693 RepID=D5E455_PRIM1|nr:MULTISPECIES: Gfo/Idh/MocA family oxidoreductase [Priestia]ADE72580.1 oxidoreductase, Gfo/Idh/Moca family [Priestia megaterium QM B1551]MBG9929493.1 oxidoreductase [Priestia aryabhattai]
MKTHVRWGVLSTAQVAQDELLPAYMKAINAAVTAIASSNIKVKEIASKFEIPKIYESYDKLLEDPDIDAVYIPLPNALHSHWVKKAAKKGKHVLCEKPAALTFKETKEMIETCRENGVMFMEGFMYHFHLQHQRVKEIIASGEIGNVKTMKATLSSYLKNQNGNIRMNGELGGGSLYDMGCYCIHAIRNILNSEPKRVFTSMQKDHDRQVDISVTGLLELNNGMTAIFDAAMDRTRTDYYEIIGTEGSIQLPRAFAPQVFKGKASILIYTEDGNYRTEEALGDQYKLQVEYLSNCILEGEIPSYFTENTINNMKAIDACFKSVEKEAFINVSPEDLKVSK